MIQWNRDPDDRTVRQFAVFAPVGFAVWGLLAAWYWQQSGWGLALGAVGVLIFAGSRIDLRVARYGYVAMSALTWPIGWVVSRLLVVLLYYGVLTPIGLIMRLTGRDPLQRRFEPQAASYWHKRPPPRDAASYFRQF